MIELWELQGESDCRYSTFAWRSRLALLHKGLPFSIHPVSVTDKDAISFSGQTKVPILRNGSDVIYDSWNIAIYLERTFPSGASLFGGEEGETLTQFFNLWTDRELIPVIVPGLMRDVLDCVSEKDAVHHRSNMEAVFRKPLETLYAERAKSIEQFRRRLQIVRKVVEKRAYLGGNRPSYADYILFGVLQWVRVVSLEQALEADDPVSKWFEKMLDVHGGAGRLELSRLDRLKMA